MCSLQGTHCKTGLKLRVMQHSDLSLRQREDPCPLCHQANMALRSVAVAFTFGFGWAPSPSPGNQDNQDDNTTEEERWRSEASNHGEQDWRRGTWHQPSGWRNWWGANWQQQQQQQQQHQQQQQQQQQPQWQQQQSQTAWDWQHRNQQDQAWALGIPTPTTSLARAASRTHHRSTEQYNGQRTGRPARAGNRSATIAATHNAWWRRRANAAANSNQPTLSYNDLGGVGLGKQQELDSPPYAVRHRPW